MTHNTSIPNQNLFNFALIFGWNWVWNFIQKIPPWEIWHITLLLKIKIVRFCAYFCLKLVWNFIQKIPRWEIWHRTLQLQIKIVRFCAYFWLKLVWNLIQKIPPWEIWHITLLFQIKISQFCAYFWLKLVWNFSQKIPPWEISHIPLLIPNTNFTFQDFVFILWAEIVYEISFKRYLLLRIWHINHFYSESQVIQFCAYFWPENRMKFYSKDTSLRNMTHNTSSSKSIFLNFVLIFLAEIRMKFHSKRYLLENHIWHIILMIQNQYFLNYVLIFGWN